MRRVPPEQRWLNVAAFAGMAATVLALLRHPRLALGFCAAGVVALVFLVLSVRSDRR
ncbi:hypothetical protein [Sphingomonas bacterium]|uniref:hypothetical protein n=1 Tax=Sphingomonas bacterium TaxID=1895847 RepID=UPI0015758924|nr:hypothetical protein [Sphingomonas bacterium]